MGIKATASISITGWDEKPIHEVAGLPKLTHTSVTAAYQGELSGESRVEYLMMYREDGSASYIGLERFVGSINGKSGSITLQHNGVFEAGTAKGTCLVIAGSGTDGLRGLQGTASFISTSSGTRLELDFTIA
jgi:hypothetical protein